MYKGEGLARELRNNQIEGDGAIVSRAYRSVSTSRSQSRVEIPLVSDANETENDQMNEKNNRIRIRRVHVHAKVLIFITKSLRLVSAAISWIIVLLFFKALVEGNVEKSLATAWKECTSQENVSCYSAIMQLFFSLDKIIQSSRLLIRISSSGRSNSAIIYEVGFPLSENNPFILITILFYTILSTFLMHYFHNLLVEIEKITAPTGNNEVVRRRPPGRPAPIV